MNSSFLILILFLACSGNVTSQIIGQFLQDAYEYPRVEVYFKNTNQKVESKEDGSFILPIPIETDKSELILHDVRLTVEIQNINIRTTTLDLGKIEFPNYKYLEIAEYELLTDAEKKSCFPLTCWTQILGYYTTDFLEKDYILINDKRITDFVYCSSSKTIKVEWNIIKGNK